MKKILALSNVDGLALSKVVGITLFLLIFIFQKSSFSQDKHLIDSLNHELKNHQQDTTGANILYKLAGVYLFVDKTKCMDYAKQCLSLSRELSFEAGIANAYYMIARVNVNYGNYSEALTNQLNALKIRREIGDRKGEAFSLINIGLIYNDIDSINLSLKNYQAALSIAREFNDSLLLHSCYLNLGYSWTGQGNYPEALKQFSSALIIAQALDNKNAISGTLNQTAEMYEKQGNYQEAIKNYLNAIKVIEESGNEALLANPYQGIGKIYMELHAYADARKFLNKSLQISKRLATKINLAIAYKRLSKLDSIEGNFRGSLENYKLSVLYFDSIFSIERNQSLIQMQMQFDFDKKELQTKTENEKELQKQKLLRNGFVGGFAIVLLFAGVFFHQRNKISKAKMRSEELLLNILPAETAEELKATGTTKAKDFSEVTVLFTDFKNFTAISEKLSAQELVNEINFCYSAFDNIISRHNIEKIKTIGDSYMCAGGLPVANKTNAADTISAAIEIRDFMVREKQKRESEGKSFFEIRIGIHTGPVVAGIVGIKKFAYDIWGDTVNIASRMESSGEVGKVNISGSTYELIKDLPNRQAGNPMAIGFICSHRGKIEAKNKGQVDMYFVEKR